MPVTEQDRKRFEGKFNSEIVNTIKTTIMVACGSKPYESFNPELTLQEVIDSKFKSDDERFVAYILCIDKIVEGIRDKYHFAILDGIDLSWTPYEIIDVILTMWYMIPKYTLEDLQKEGWTR